MGVIPGPWTTFAFSRRTAFWRKWVQNFTYLHFSWSRRGVQKKIFFSIFSYQRPCPKDLKMEKEKIYILVYPSPGAWKMQICKVLDSFSPKCSSARKGERCSQVRGPPKKYFFSDNITNIDTNLKKCYNFLGWVRDH